MVVDATVVVCKVIVDSVGDSKGSFFHQRLQHLLLITCTVVAAQVLVVADESTRTAGVSFTRVVLWKKWTKGPQNPSCLVSVSQRTSVDG